MYQNGADIRSMRVSALYAVPTMKSADSIHALEPDTWSKLQDRMKGLTAFASLRRYGNFMSRDLPPAFESWLDYRDYLLDHLVEDEAQRSRYLKLFGDASRGDAFWLRTPFEEEYLKQCVQLIVTNDNWPDASMAQWGSYHTGTLKRWKEQMGGSNG